MTKNIFKLKSIFCLRPRADIHNVYVLLVTTVINREAIRCWSIKAICLVGVSDKYNLAIKKYFDIFQYGNFMRLNNFFITHHTRDYPLKFAIVVLSQN